MSVVTEALAVARRDLAVELTGRDAATTVVPFTLAAAVLVGLGVGAGRELLAATGPVVVWLLVLLAAAPVSVQIARAERDEGCWGLLRGLVSASGLLWGKTASTWVLLLAAYVLAAAAAAVLFEAPVGLAGLAAGLLGTLGLAALTVVFGVVVGASRRAGLLSVLLLPLGLPVLVAGVGAATGVGSAAGWLLLLLVYDAVALTAAWAMFPTLLED